MAHSSPTQNQSTYFAIDFLSDFGFNPVTKDMNVVKGNEAIKSSINNILRTNTFDRLMAPNIGANLKRFLFEPMTVVTANRIREAIETTIAELEPRGEAYEVNVVSDEERNQYSIQIRFYVKDQIEPVNFETTLSRVR